MKGSIGTDENISITTSFIHDVFSKEILKSSPVNISDSAVHLEISIEDDETNFGIKYSALMASGRNGSVFNFSNVPNCQVEYEKEETFVSRALLQSLRGVDGVEGPVAFPSSDEINKNSMNEFSNLLQKIKASSSPQGEELLKHLPDRNAFEKQSEKVKNDLKGIHEMVKFLCEQLKESQNLYNNISTSD